MSTGSLRRKYRFRRRNRPRDEPIPMSNGRLRVARAFLAAAPGSIVDGSTDLPQEFDIVCLGGGVAGEAIAVGLRGSGLRLAVVERELVRASARTGDACHPRRFFVQPKPSPKSVGLESLLRHGWSGRSPSPKSRHAFCGSRATSTTHGPPQRWGRLNSPRKRRCTAPFEPDGFTRSGDPNEKYTDS
jgi:hypothetical protein